MDPKEKEALLAICKSLERTADALDRIAKRMRWHDEHEKEMATLGEKNRMLLASHSEAILRLRRHTQPCPYCGEKGSQILRGNAVIGCLVCVSDFLQRSLAEYAANFPPPKKEEELETP